jgi:hypothetical protein
MNILSALTDDIFLKQHIKDWRGSSLYGADNNHFRETNTFGYWMQWRRNDILRRKFE